MQHHQLPPPHNIQAEQALLGSVLLNNANYGAIANLIEPTDFFEPVHQQILFQMGELIAAGKVASTVTLQDAFPDVEVAPGMPVRRYLAKLMAEGVNSVLELKSFTSRVHDLAEMRAVIAAANDLRRAPLDGIGPEAALTELWDRLDNIRSGHGDDTGARGTIAALAAQLLEQDTAPVVSSGLADLDKAIAGGWRAGRLYVLAGRPGMGKTVFGLSTARRVARKGDGVSAFLLEIDAREGTARIVADELARGAFPIPYRDIVANTLDSGQKALVHQAVERISQLPIYLDASGGLSMTEIEARAKVDKAKFEKSGRRLGAVVIDYLGLLKAPERYRGQKVHELGEIVLAAKTMAKRINAAVLLLSQLNRGVEGRDDKRPTMSDLRDSGNIEEHADFVGLLYRPFYYTEKSPQWRNQDPATMERGERERNRLELIIGKNRLGPTTMVDLWCDPALAAVDSRAKY